MQPLIPIWMIVMSAGSLVWNSIILIRNIIMMLKRSHDPEFNFSSIILDCFNCLLLLFLIGWFIFGNILVYSKWNLVQYDSNEANNYC